jgi:vacuolar protein sorting-associated protein 35
MAVDMMVFDELEQLQ